MNSQSEESGAVAGSRKKFIKLRINSNSLNCSHNAAEGNVNSKAASLHTKPVCSLRYRTIKLLGADRHYNADSSFIAWATGHD